MIKNSRRLSLLLGSLIVLFIISSPYLTYLHKLIDPDSKSMTTFFGVIKGGRYVYTQTYIYVLFSKLSPLILIIIWFLTNKHWWVHALIIPISVYLFQLINVFNDSEQYVDEIEFIYTVPIAAIVLAILYFLRSKMSLYIKAMDLKKEMDQKMKFPKKFD